MREGDEILGYWEDFYGSDRRAQVPAEPTAFAQWVATQEPVPLPLVDIGMGTGRDTLWFASQGFRALGLDAAESAVRLASELAERRGLPAEFRRLDLHDDAGVTKLAKRVSADFTPRVVYARFLVHALDDEGRRNLWRLSRGLLAAGGRVYVEFRVAQVQHEFGEHFRRFVAPAVVESEIEVEGGKILSQEVGTGLAVYKTEDPPVCRIVAEWL